MAILSYSNLQKKAKNKIKSQFAAVTSITIFDPSIID